MSIKDLTPEFLMGFKLQLAIAEVNRLFIRSEVISRMSRQKHEEKSVSFGEKRVVRSETKAEDCVCVLREWIRTLKHENDVPCVEQDATKNRYAKMTVIGRRGTSEFQTPRCLVRKDLRVTSLATPQMLAFCTGVARQVTSLHWKAVRNWTHSFR